MTPVEALQLALLKEEASINLYKSMAQEYKVIQDLLNDLLNEEFKHKKRIEDKITELTT